MRLAYSHFPINVTIGKWEYARRMIFLNLICVPLIKLTTVDRADFNADFCFVAVNQLSTTTLFPSTRMSAWQWLRSRLSVPRGPFTVTLRALMVTVTLSGIGADKVVFNNFMRTAANATETLTLL